MQAILHDPETGCWRHFGSLQRVLVATSLADVVPLLAEVEAAVEGCGWFAAGYVAYDAAPAFDDALTVRAPEATGLPLACFGLFRECRRGAFAPGAADAAGGGMPLWRPDWDRTRFAAAVGQIHARIARGDTYQVNLTQRLRASVTPASRPALSRWVAHCGCRYAAWLDLGEQVIASSSPELFFARRGKRLWSQPMKGTAPRGMTLEEDRAQAAWLQASVKNRAENVMITDMIRNDLGRIARPGSVRVPALFRVERLPTAWQMTSTVQGESAASFVEIMRALFPCASITGAPKRMAMSIIAELEASPRGIYTGAIGWLAPGGRAQFSVAIRTIEADIARGRGVYGVGGGIVWDSVAAEEWAECEIKSRVLTEPREAYALLETLGWSPGEGFALLAYHLERLAASAEYFEMPCDRADVMRRLNEAVAGSDQALRVRLLLERTGVPTVEAFPMTPLPSPYRVALAAASVPRDDWRLYHKTTARGLYDRARESYPRLNDVILWNERGEVTESTMANVAIRRGGRLVTPPVACGLLAGTQRRTMLVSGELEEGVVTVDELRAAATIYLFNSVRGIWEAQWVDDPRHCQMGD